MNLLFIWNVGYIISIVFRKDYILFQKWCYQMLGVLSFMAFLR